ncbi:putative phosphatidate phosphatase [Ruditapes philippinarum]|uniref:putative phosphatidate phosphatase n=1 Tax=Ruditapes philippinarum TaxID=129788 RepID=UPI00295B321E|nr:putative phosphatidate phosphatase [Ruditapes philippinarum]
MSAIHEKRMAVLKRVLSDVIIIGSGGAVLLLFRFLGDPYKRGFFCDDESLKHPFKESTVSSAMLYGIGFALGSVLIGVVEYIWIYGVKERDPQQTVDIKKYGKHWILIRDIYLSLVPYIFGAALEHIISNIGKYSIGRLRPHFFDVCKVDFSKVNCSAGYIEEFECLGDNKNRIREMRLSFPSGHASFHRTAAIYLMIFSTTKANIFVQVFNKACTTDTDICYGLLQHVLAECQTTNIIQTDVIAGAVIGCCKAYCVSDLFSMADTRETYREMYMNMKGQSGREQNSDTEKISDTDVRM